MFGWRSVFVEGFEECARNQSCVTLLRTAVLLDLQLAIRVVPVISLRMRMGVLPFYTLGILSIIKSCASQGNIPRALSFYLRPAFYSALGYPYMLLLMPLSYC